MAWTIEFFEDDHGRQPAREWLRSLDSGKRAAAIAAIEVYLAGLGLDVCETEHGKQLGGGLFEFRIRHDETVIRGKAGEERSGKRSEVLLRIFCHAHGEKVVLLLGGYDKGAASSKKRQDREIEIARGRLRSFKLQTQRRRASERRRNDGADSMSLTLGPIWGISYLAQTEDAHVTTKFDDFVREIEDQSTDEERQELNAARARFKIGARIQRQRVAAGFTQQQLAAASGIAQADISRIERGQANPTAGTLEALGGPLGLTLDLIPTEDFVTA